jgi:hypothetical protein
MKCRANQLIIQMIAPLQANGLAPLYSFRRVRDARLCYRLSYCFRCNERAIDVTHFGALASFN